MLTGNFSISQAIEHKFDSVGILKTINEIKKYEVLFIDDVEFQPKKLIISRNNNIVTIIETSLTQRKKYKYDLDNEVETILDKYMKEYRFDKVVIKG